MTAQLPLADLDAAIRAALANTEHGDRPDGGMCHADCCGDGYRCECGLDEKPRAAIRAVLDIHRPVECGNLRHDGGSGLHCALEECETGENPYGHYPCGTVQAIASALGVPQAGKP